MQGRSQQSNTDLLSSDFLYLLPLTKESTVLYLGCRDGVSLDTACARSGRVHGVVSSPKNKEHYREKMEREGVKNIEFYTLTPGAELPFDSEKFDSIILNGEFRESVARGGGWSDLHRVLKPGGMLCAGVPNPHSLQGVRGVYTEMLYNCGFEDVRYYMAYPSYTEPRILIPFEDGVALVFILKKMGVDRRWVGFVLSMILAFIVGVRIARELFPGYIILAVK